MTPEEILRQIDSAISPERMSMDDALDFLTHVRDELGERIAALQEDLAAR